MTWRDSRTREQSLAGNGSLSGFPSVAVLWNGAVLGGIINAVKTAEAPDVAHYRQWIRNNYILNGGDGREGVITFAGGHWYSKGPLVGVFSNVHSRRSPVVPPHEWSTEQALRGAPQYQRDLADQSALTYLELEVCGRTDPRVTAAFWDDDHGYLTAPDPWETVLEHGANIIEDECIEDLDLALERARISDGMCEEQVSFVRALFERKTAHPPKRLLLSDAEADWLRSQSSDPRSIDLCSELLKEMGIIVPRT
jgi:hypothetical protein